MTSEQNPFWVWTPEDIAADKAVELFVEPLTDFPAIESPSHTFIHGPRGSGKSMMFRMMRPDCARRLRANCELNELPYLGVYIPIKKTEISQTEMVYLDKHPARYVFNEHMLCLYFAQKICDELASSRLDYNGANCDRTAFALWVKQRLIQRVTVSTNETMLTVENVEGVDAWVKGMFAEMASFLHIHWEVVEQLVRQLPLRPDSLLDFKSNLLSYHSFLLPFVTGLRELGLFPNAPVYLLVDDADNLSLTQTQILNSWIATRTTGSVCLKASTQMRYKTRLTFGGQRIEAPHDYHEVDVSVLYTTRRDHYLNRLEQIVAKRLKSAHLNENPRLFFPEDEAQETEVKKIENDFRVKAEKGEGRGNRARDDANRYGRPEFIRLLGGERKSTSKYSYSGFNQLAHISSGVVRWFLEPASRMFAEQVSVNSHGAEITMIEPRIQNEKIRDFSEEFFQDDFDKMKEDAKTQAREVLEWQEREKDYQRLEMLINAMGKTFFAILTDKDKSERRVFSIALSDPAQEDVRRVLNLGVEEGYLYKATIGTKTGHGRTARYVLSRRLAPYFSLDPTSFSGYLFVTNDNLRQAMNNPNARLRDVEALGDDIQMELPVAI
jgi:hypothetical protein